MLPCPLSLGHPFPDPGPVLGPLSAGDDIFSLILYLWMLQEISFGPLVSNLTAMQWSFDSFGVFGVSFRCRHSCPLFWGFWMPPSHLPSGAPVLMLGLMDLFSGLRFLPVHQLFISPPTCYIVLDSPSSCSGDCSLCSPILRSRVLSCSLRVPFLYLCSSLVSLKILQ